MNILRGLLITLVIFGLFGSFLATKTSAQYDWNATKQQIKEMGDDSPIKTPDDITDALKRILRWTYYAFFILAIYFILLAAFSYFTAGGNPEKIQKANTSLLWAFVAIAIGLISVGAAQIITSFISKTP